MNDVLLVWNLTFSILTYLWTMVSSLWTVISFCASLKLYPLHNLSLRSSQSICFLVSTFPLMSQITGSPAPDFPDRKIPAGEWLYSKPGAGS